MKKLWKDLKGFPSSFKGIYKLLHQKYAKLRRILCRLLQEKNWEKGRHLLLVQHASFQFNELNLRSDQLGIHTCSYKLYISYIGDKYLTQITRTIVTTRGHLCKIFKQLHFSESYSDVNFTCNINPKTNTLKAEVFACQRKKCPHEKKLVPIKKKKQYDFKKMIFFLGN